MKYSGKIAAIGDKDAVLAFKALGIDVFPASAPAKIKEIIKTLMAENYSIILITEKEAANISDVFQKLKMQPYPILLPIPDGAEKTNFGMNRIIENMEKAIGTSTLLNKVGKKE